MSDLTEKYQLRNESRARLLDLLPPGSTLYAIIRTVAPSGLSRTMSFYAMKDNRPVWITRDVARMLDLPMVNGARDVARVRGGGMDMVFSVAYDLSCMIHHGQPNAGYTLKHEAL